MKCPYCSKSLLLVKDTNGSAKSSAPAADVSDVGALLDSVIDDQLNDWEKGFITDLRARHEKYGTRLKMSEKQLATLRKIAAGDAGDDWV